MSGVLFRTTVLRNVTLVLLVAIPPPPEPLLNLIMLPVSEVVPRLEMPPPRPPATLPENDVPKMRDMPGDWAFRPPPLIGAVFPEKLDPVTVSMPEFIMPPPPTPVVVFAVKWVRLTNAVALALLESAPPLPAVLPERMTRLSLTVPPFRIPPPRLAVFPSRMETEVTCSVAAAATSRIRRFVTDVRLITVLYPPATVICPVMTGRPSLAVAGVVMS